MLDNEIVGKRLYVYNKETRNISEAEIIEEVQAFGMVIGFKCKTDQEEFTAPRNHIFKSLIDCEEFVQLEDEENYKIDYTILKNNKELYRVLTDIVNLSEHINDTKKRAVLHRLKDILVDERQV